MNVLPYPAPGADPECFAAAARYVQREYSETGYRMTLEGCGGLRAVFRVSHFDGSEFRVVSDLYGNVATLPDHDDISTALAMHNAHEEDRKRERDHRAGICCAPEMCPTCFDHGGHVREVAR